MKRIFSTQINQRYLHCGVLFLRICIACFMLSHGIKKMNKYFGPEPIDFADPLGIGVPASFALTVFAEFFCSILVLLGLATRLALVPLIITMSVASFITLLPDGFGKMEFALLYLVIYIMLFITGGGKYSIDRLIENKN
jgi:putative oxidoreductase